MLFAQRVPRQPLAEHIASIWLYQDSPRLHALERVLPIGTAQLIVNLKEDQTRLYDAENGMRVKTTTGTVLCGVRSRYAVIDTAEQEHVMGVVFKPGGIGPFLRMPAWETSDRDVAVDALWGRRRAAVLRDRLLAACGAEAKLDALEAELAEMWEPSVAHPAVRFALRTFAERPQATTIAAVADAVGLSAKRFIERFKSDVGLTPKRYCRIRRFQRALARAHRGRPVDWASVALDCGYADQAHFIHDFRGFAGLTPGAYLEVRTDHQNHVKFLQSPAAAR